MSQLTFRRATASDAPAIAALHIASWRDAFAAILDPDWAGAPLAREAEASAAASA